MLNMASIAMLQMPTISAPTNTSDVRAQYAYYAAAVVIAAVLVAFLTLKWLRPSGSETIRYRAEEESKAIEILKSQVEENKAEIAELRTAIKELAVEKESDRNERHELKNKMQIVLMWCEAYYGLIVEIKAELGDQMPAHLLIRLGAMKKPSDIFNP